MRGVLEHYDVIGKFSALRTHLRRHPKPAGYVEREGVMRQYAGLVVDVQPVSDAQSSVNLLQ